MVEQPSGSGRRQGYSPACGDYERDGKGVENLPPSPNAAMALASQERKTRMELVTKRQQEARTLTD
jgi:hypothetical protein